MHGKVVVSAFGCSSSCVIQRRNLIYPQNKVFTVVPKIAGGVRYDKDNSSLIFELVHLFPAGSPLFPENVLMHLLEHDALIDARCEKVSKCED